MATFDANTLADIKSRIDLADLISEYGIDLHRSGVNAKACCPFHKEKTPSFTVNTDKGFYKCFGCGEGGDHFTFVQKYEGIPFIEAVRKLAERAGVKLEERYDPQAKARAKLYQINQEVAAFYRRCLLQTREAAEAREYLQRRSLDGEVAERFGLGYAPDRQDALLKWAEKHGFTPDELVSAGLLAPPRTPGDRYYDRFHGRITFPICDPQGRVIAFSCRLLRPSAHTGKYVNSPETSIFKKATTLYAFHLARAAIAKATPRRAIVCEGQIDVIRCHACGFPVALASQGTSFTADHVALLKRCADSADLVFDGDKAGVKAAIRTMGLFLAAGLPVRIVSLPEGEDPDSLLLTRGAEAFRDCLAKAEDPAPYLIRRLREQEASPDAMDATLRMAKMAVATVLDCPEPVLTARFLQDAAEALHLPVETLTRDLETLRTDAAEAEARRQAFQAKQQEVRVPVPAPRAPEALVVSETEFVPEEAMASDFVPVDDLPSPEEPFVPELPEPPPVAALSLVELEASQNLAGALCELLAHHFHEPEVINCLIKHLPPHFVHNPYAARLYDLAVKAALAGDPCLAPPKDDPAFADYLGRLFATPDRIAADGEYTPLLYAHDLIRQYWLREYTSRVRMLEPTSPEAFALTLSCKRLQTLTWDEAAPFMDAADPKLKPVQAQAQPTRPESTPNLGRIDPEPGADATPPPPEEVDTPGAAGDWMAGEATDETDFYDTL
ncbi:MAG: DNA primase [Candidatus Spyradenecus sp.]